MDTLISRLEAVVGKLEGFTAKFCDGSDKSMPRSVISINESLQPALDNRDATDKCRHKSDVAQLWHSSDMPGRPNYSQIIIFLFMQLNRIVRIQTLFSVDLWITHLPTSSLFYGLPPSSCHC